MSDAVGIGMLGVRHPHAGGKLAALQGSPAWRVVGACEPDEGVRSEAQESPAFAGLVWMTQKELLARSDIAVVAIEGEPVENLARAEAALDAGKHVHLEKPAGVDAVGIERLVGQARDAGLLLQLGYMFRYNPAFIFAFGARESGWLGDVHSVRGRMSTSISEDKREELARYPGGMMYELGCHLLDGVVRLLGAPTDVHAYLRHDGISDDALPDNTLAVFEFESAVATLEVTAMDVGPFPRRRLEVYGTAGSIVIEPLEPPRVLACFDSPPDGHPEGWHEVDVPAYQRYADDFEELASCVRSGDALSYNGEHDIAVQRALMRACGR